MRVLAILIVLGLVASADAQVFKPKGKKSEATEKKPTKAAKKKSVKAKKKSTKAKKSAAAERSRSDDPTSEPESRDEDEVSDKDYVKITDDDEIE